MKCIVLAQVNRISIYTKRLVRKFSSQGSIGKQIPDAAFQIDPGIRSCGACLVTDLIKFFEMISEDEMPVLSASCLFHEKSFYAKPDCQRSGILKYLVKIKSPGSSLIKRRARNCIGKFCKSPPPLSSDLYIISKLFHITVLSRTLNAELTHT